MQLFSPNRPSEPIPSTIRHVHVFVCVSVCLRHLKTSTSGGKLWSKGEALILASDPNFQKVSPEMIFSLSLFDDF